MVRQLLVLLDAAWTYRAATHRLAGRDDLADLCAAFTADLTALLDLIERSGMPDVLALADLPPDDPDLVPCAPPEPAQAALGLWSAAVSEQHWLTRLVPYLEKWGVNYRQVEGCESRGRPVGAFDPGGVQWHHTASTSSAANPRPSLRTLVEGRPDLPGPLCQLAPDYEGVVWVVALGRANHAGAARAHGALPAGDGNALRVGFEVMTSGTQRMPAAQVDSLILATVAVLDMLGVAPADVADHLARHADTSVTGKWDLGAGTGAYVPLDIRPHVKTIAALLAAGPQGDDMPTPADLLNADIVPGPPLGDGKPDPKNPTWTTAQYLQRTFVATWQAKVAAQASQAQLAGLTAVIAALAKDSQLTPEQITAAAKAGAAAALDEKITDADVTLNVEPASS